MIAPNACANTQISADTTIASSKAALSAGPGR